MVTKYKTTNKELWIYLETTTIIITVASITQNQLTSLTTNPTNSITTTTAPMETTGIMETMFSETTVVTVALTIAECKVSLPIIHNNHSKTTIITRLCKVHNYQDRTLWCQTTDATQDKEG